MNNTSTHFLKVKLFKHLRLSPPRRRGTPIAERDVRLGEKDHRGAPAIKVYWLQQRHGR